MTNSVMLPDILLAMSGQKKYASGQKELIDAATVIQSQEIEICRLNQIIESNRMTKKMINEFAEMGVTINEGEAAEILRWVQEGECND